MGGFAVAHALNGYQTDAARGLRRVTAACMKRDFTSCRRLAENCNHVNVLTFEVSVEEDLLRSGWHRQK